MSYLHLDDERLLAVVDGLNRILVAPLDPDEVGAVGARVAQKLTSAAGAEVTFSTEAVPRRVPVGDTDATEGSISVALEREGLNVGAITVMRRSGSFDDADVEALRLLAEGLAAQLENASLHSVTARESRVDVLTGLGNSLAFEERVEWELSRAHRYEEPLSLALFRIDHFVRLQERFGPDGIDEIVVEIAEIFSRGRAADSFFRISSDRFAVLMPNTTAEGAEIAAIRMAWQVANLRDADGTITISSGVHQADIPDPRTFIADAEAALERPLAPVLSN
jgi:diguanylate cyclase (GGDEF)-like protein